MITGLMHGTLYNFTGSLIDFSAFFHPAWLTSFYAFPFSSLVALISSFTLTWVWDYSEQQELGKKVAKK